MFLDVFTPLRRRLGGKAGSDWNHSVVSLKECEGQDDQHLQDVIQYQERALHRFIRRLERSEVAAVLRLHMPDFKMLPIVKGKWEKVRRSELFEYDDHDL